MNHVINKDNLNIKDIERFEDYIGIVLINNNNILFNIENDNISFPKINLSYDDVSLNDISKLFFHETGYIIYEDEFSNHVSITHFKKKVKTENGEILNTLTKATYFMIDYQEENIKKNINTEKTKNLAFIPLDDIDALIPKFAKKDRSNHEELLEIMSIIQLVTPQIINRSR